MGWSPNMSPVPGNIQGITSLEHIFSCRPKALGDMLVASQPGAGDYRRGHLCSSFIRRQNKQQSALFLLSKLERSSNSSLAAEGQPAVMAQIPRHHSRDYTQTWHGSSVRIVEASGPAGLTVPREDQLEEAFKRKRAKYKELIEICQNRVLRAHCLAIHSMGPPSCSREPSGTCCCWKALKVLKLLWSKGNNLLDSTSSQDTTWGLITQVRVYDVENPETLIKSLMFHSKVC